VTRLTIRFDEEQDEWLEAESDARDRSKGWIVRAVVDAARGAGSPYADTLGGAVDDDRDDLGERLEDLAEHVAALERVLGDDVTEPVTSGDTSTVTAGDSAGESHSEASVTSGDTVTDDESTGAVTDGDDVAELPGRPAVVRAVERVAEGWDDSPSRLAARKAAAAAVVEHAVETGEAVGKSTDAVERIHEENAVSGQSYETWWRKNVRPVLKAIGEYDRGAHGYRVQDLET
jgi:hypothetical protein